MTDDEKAALLKKMINSVFENAGLVIVPRVPTNEMQDAGVAEHGKGINRDLEVLTIWTVMVNKAQEALKDDFDKLIHDLKEAPPEGDR